LIVGGDGSIDFLIHTILYVVDDRAIVPSLTICADPFVVEEDEQDPTYQQDEEGHNQTQSVHSLVITLHFSIEHNKEDDATVGCGSRSRGSVCDSKRVHQRGV